MYFFEHGKLLTKNFSHIKINNLLFNVCKFKSYVKTTASFVLLNFL